MAMIGTINKHIWPIVLIATPILLVSCNSHHNTLQGRWLGRYDKDTFVMVIDTLNKTIALDEKIITDVETHVYHTKGTYSIIDSNKIISKIFSEVSRFRFDNRGDLFFEPDSAESDMPESIELLHGVVFRRE